MSEYGRYFIFLVRIGQFPENGQRQMAYIIYLIELWGNTYKKYIFFEIGSYECKNIFLLMPVYITKDQHI